MHGSPDHEDDIELWAEKQQLQNDNPWVEPVVVGIIGIICFVLFVALKW